MIRAAEVRWWHFLYNIQGDSRGKKVKSAVGAFIYSTTAYGLLYS
jgi:hypothetical protein